MLFDFSDSDWHFGADRCRAHGKCLSDHPVVAAPLGVRGRPGLPPASTATRKCSTTWSPIRNGSGLLAPGEPYELTRLPWAGRLVVRVLCSEG